MELVVVFVLVILLLALHQIKDSMQLDVDVIV